MTALPQVYNPAPVIVEPVDEKTYPDSYLTRLVIEPPDAGGKQALTVVFRPYNYATKELYPQTGRDVTLLISDVFAEAARATTLAVAMGAVLQAASLLLEEKTLTAQEATLLLPIETFDENGNPLDEAVITSNQLLRDTQLAAVRERLAAVKGQLGA